MNNYYEGEDFNNIYKRICKDLLASEDLVENKTGDSLTELINPTITLTNPKNCFAFCRNMSFDYLKGEIEFYLSGSPYLIDIACHSKFWEKISDDGWSVNSNYGKLLLHDRNESNFTQFDYAKNCLQNNIESKKAVMVIYNKQHARKSKDNPCTMFLQFLYRENMLHLFVHMRSSDIWFGMPYDVPFFVLLLYKMAHELNLKVGTYIHNSTSLHLYKRNETALLKSIASSSTTNQDSRIYFEKYLREYII